MLNTEKDGHYFIRKIDTFNGESNIKLFLNISSFYDELEKVIRENQLGVMSYCSPPHLLEHQESFKFETPVKSIYPSSDLDTLKIMLTVTLIMNYYKKCSFKNEGFYDNRTNILFDKSGFPKYEFGYDDPILQERRGILRNFLDIMFPSSYLRSTVGYELKEKISSNYTSAEVEADVELLNQMLDEIIDLLNVHFVIVDISKCLTKFATFNEEELNKYLQRLKNVKVKLMTLSLKFSSNADSSMQMIKLYSNNLFRINELFPYTF